LKKKKTEKSNAKAKEQTTLTSLCVKNF